MTRVLVCVIPEKGHLNPYIGPAQALQQLGADVVVQAPGDISAQLAVAGLTQVAQTFTTAGDAHRGAAFAERVRDPVWLRRWIQALLVDAAEPSIEPLRAVIRDVRPDVAVLDPMVYAAAIACELERVPWVAVSNSLNPALPDDLDSELLRTVGALAPARAALFARHGMSPRFRGCDVLSPHLTVAFTTEALVGPVAGVELVGPSLPRGARGDETAFPWDWLDRSRPLVYASFGSQIYHQPALIRRVLDAVATRPVQLVLSASELATSGELGVVPTNVLLCPYVPQLAVLRRAAVMITHGGANSVMEAITCGVPLVVAPLCNDQFHQVHFVERAGIGRAIDADHATAHDIGVALDALLADPGGMPAVSASYQRDGAAETARLVMAVAAGTHPARAS
jgi:zeaxanthin glucosyltransferase